MNKEYDPDGKSGNEVGAKMDGGKLLPDLVLGDFAHALHEVVRVGTHGAEKYTRHGWLEVTDGITRYSEAAERHRLARQKGELMDPDSGLLHEAHECWNRLAVLTLKLKHTENLGGH